MKCNELEFDLQSDFASLSTDVLNCKLQSVYTCFLQMVKRLEKARKKAETLTDSVDISDKAKMKQIKE